MVAKGSIVEFEATANEGYEVNNWEGGVKKYESYHTKASILVIGDVDVKVTFKTLTMPKNDEVRLTYGVRGRHGVLGVMIGNPPVAAPYSGGIIKKGKRLLFKAFPDEGYEVDEWEGVVKYATDKNQASAVASVDIKAFVSFKRKEITLSDVEVTKVSVDSKEWNKATKTITLPNTIISFDKKNISVMGKAVGTTEEMALEVDNILPEIVFPTETGVPFVITTKATLALKAQTITVTVKKEKKIEEKKNVRITKITCKGKDADLVANAVIFAAETTFTKEEIKVEGMVEGEASSKVLDIEDIEPITTKLDGMLFTITVKETKEYKSIKYTLSVVHGSADLKEKIAIKQINICEYPKGDLIVESKMKNGAFVIDSSKLTSSKGKNNVRVYYGNENKYVLPTTLNPMYVFGTNYGKPYKASVTIEGVKLEVLFYVE